MKWTPPGPLWAAVVACVLCSCTAPAEEADRAVERGPTGAESPEPPRLHHVHLNSVDPDRAIDWYLRVWPEARRTTVDGHPAVQSDMFLLFNEVAQAPTGSWSETLHRPDAQSAFWHIGAYVNTTDMRDQLSALDISHLPLFVGPDDTEGVWRSGLAPYGGMLTAEALDSAEPREAREGGFSYVLAPDAALFEFTGGPRTQPSFSHVHFFHESPRCAANWYVEMLGMTLPPIRNEDGTESPRPLWEPCEGELAEATWPSLEPVGTVRGPRGDVRFGNGSMSWYPRQCVVGRCGDDQPLVPSRGQVFDHVAFTVQDLQSWFDRLRSSGVTVLEEPYPFEDTHAFMIQDPDGLAIELIEDNSEVAEGRD